MHSFCNADHLDHHKAQPSPQSSIYELSVAEEYVEVLHHCGQRRLVYDQECSFLTDQLVEGEQAYGLQIQALPYFAYQQEHIFLQLDVHIHFPSDYHFPSYKI
ncbi:hypothetical protein HanXRQr2_Chr09g0410771 [Helianthus annuus]|uniref:Uncharacterized protein n=1 Tax=Helianthus annuus TaxID=4232 RepID=A0A9K3NAE5_HELAN|nr:hypothetical protein HanXRQr2_Chr09g0410771 [Helianthus annuus]